MSKNLCKWPALENTIQSGLEIDHQTQVANNQHSLLPVLTEKTNQTKTFSLSWCQFWWMQMLLFVITDLRAFLGSSDHVGNIKKFMGYFLSSAAHRVFITLSLFLFLKKYSELLLVLFIVSRRPLKTVLRAVLWNAMQKMNPDDTDVNLEWVTNTYLLGHTRVSLQYFSRKDKHKIERRRMHLLAMPLENMSKHCTFFM